MFSYKVSDDIELKMMQAHYAQDVFNLVDKNRDHLREWLQWVDYTKSVEDTLEAGKKFRMAWAETGALQCGIWYKGKLAGMIGTHDIDHANKRSSVGYWLAKDYAGKGIVTQSVAAILDYAFNEVNLNHMTLRAATGNKKSRAVAERLGFTHEGTLRDYELNGDEFLNLEVYGMRASEWKKIKEEKLK